MLDQVNIGATDRLIRLVSGVALILLRLFTAFALWENPLFGYGVPLVGAVLVITAVVRFCPAYRLLGLKTCRTA